MLVTLLLFACASQDAGHPAPTSAADATSTTTPAATSSSGTTSSGTTSSGATSADTLATSAGTITFHPVMHATMWMDVAGKAVWVDPWTKAGNLDGPKADVLLITDVHPDHLDPKGIDAVRKDGTVVVAPAAVADELAKDGVSGLDVRKLANGEKLDVAGMTVTGVPMYNLQRGPQPGQVFHEKGRGDGFLVDVGDGRVYIAGDTECTDEMKALKDVDVAFVPMNLPYTMPPSEAAACVAAFHPAVLYPYHYWGSDLSELDKGLEGSGVEVRKREWYPSGSPF